MSRMVSGSLVPRPLLCRWGWHKWSSWAIPRLYRVTEQRRCLRKGCEKTERRDARTKEPVR